MVKKKENVEGAEVRLLSISEACAYIGVGRDSCIKLARKIGAERSIGRRRLYDKKVFDKYLDALNNKNEEVAL